jgi:surface polysaccharide O-acyltransferase-like enzyme
MQNEKQTVEWLDSLRAIATIGVIVIHTATPVVKMSYGVNTGNWWCGNLFDSAARFAVPLFLMLSGATLLGKEEEIKIFYRKRFMRVLVPFLFWMVVYWIYRWLVLPSPEQPHGCVAVCSWAIKLLLHEGISKHFWYVYMILFFYLLFPLLRKAMRGLRRKEVLWLIIGWVLLSFSLRKIPTNFYNWTGDYPQRLWGYFQLSGYLVLGYYLTTFRVETRRHRFFAAAVFLLTVIVAAVSTFYCSCKTHQLDLSMYGNATFNTLAQSIAIFLLLKNLSIGNRWLLKTQRLISNYSYGIYLSHILVIGIGFQYGIFWTMGHPAWTMPLLVVLTLVVSLLIIFVLRKLPYGKYISG